MSDTTMTKEELISKINELKNRKEKLNTDNNKARTEGKITPDAHTEGFNAIQNLGNRLNVLNVQLLQASFQSISVPGAEIKASTQKLDKASNDIQNLHKFLNTIAEVINTVNTVIGIIAKL